MNDFLFHLPTSYSSNLYPFICNNPIANVTIKIKNAIAEAYPIWSFLNPTLYK